ncbi:Transcriptional regulatory protein TcrA [Tautonia plasticadhaerens]|uniref:Transcriptional regulatory protein TcrA n=2 Tax=Tautonia plasticadhaerens TaxID=2527974 RepID=A0A518HA37_9BACT|nr:Transcriptional regulatory protein TcrA [Tautonia plasticadhaerens]
MPTALIVENDDDIREILTWLIRLHGLDAESAATGGETLANIGRHLDLVTLNPMLPDLDGFEVCEALRSCRATRLIPVLFITSLAMPEIRTRCVRAGGSAVLTMPFTPSSLFEALDEALARQGRSTEPGIGGRSD